MRIRIATLLVALLSLCGPALAADAPSADPGSHQPMQSQRDEQQLLVHKMMGDINLAAVALDLRLPIAAREHLDRASALAAELQGMLPRIDTRTQFKYGKLSYDVEEQAKDYYVPVVDDLFLLSDYESTFHAWKSREDIQETNAGIVLVTVRADVREIQAALDEARAKLEAKEFATAGAMLNDIYTHAIVDEVEITDPLWAVHDNLALARNLIREERFDSARFALEHARKELAKVKSEDHEAAAPASVRQLDASIAKVENELRAKDPTLTQRMDRTVSSWMSTVRSWF
ncbi:MAG: YfdX family protein [Spirochaetaceae bacterium]|nr:YfdX family protein [Spirochaetaceae bacterium]